LGAAAWKAGVFRNPGGHRWLLWVVAVVGGGVGGGGTLLSALEGPTPLPPAILGAASSPPPAPGYAARLPLALRSSAALRFAATGQMALTNYLVQSLVLSFLFYGYGLGFYGRLGSAAAAGVGLTVYAGQVALSRAWLKWYRFGPVEWVWRSLTYGRSQPMHR